jgi:hypothetical protein
MSSFTTHFDKALGIDIHKIEFKSEPPISIVR